MSRVAGYNGHQALVEELQGHGGGHVKQMATGRHGGHWGLLQSHCSTELDGMTGTTPDEQTKPRLVIELS